MGSPQILEEDLLIVTNEYNKFDKTRERLDLLALNRDGKLVIIELIPCT
jgi:RecB family endonuclease NucS